MRSAGDDGKLFPSSLATNFSSFPVFFPLAIATFCSFFHEAASTEKKVLLPRGNGADLFKEFRLRRSRKVGLLKEYRREEPVGSIIRFNGHFA